MEIHFKVLHANDRDISSKATNFAERKIRNLKKYLGKEQDNLGVQVYVELGKDTAAHQTGSIWRAQINLKTPREAFHANAVGEHIESAISRAVAEIQVELRKKKDQHKNVIRRGGAAVKSFMRGFRTS